MSRRLEANLVYGIRITDQDIKSQICGDEIIVPNEFKFVFAEFDKTLYICVGKSVINREEGYIDSEPLSTENLTINPDWTDMLGCWATNNKIENYKIGWRLSANYS